MRAWRRSTVLSVTLATLAALGTEPASASVPDTGGTWPSTPRPTGQYAVGRRLVHWVDPSRRDPMDATRQREIMVWLWYPAAAGRAAPGEPALPGPWGDVHAEAVVPKIGESAARSLRRLRVHAVSGAPVAPTRAKLPVLLFTPGLGWLPTDYSTLAEEMASHGYLVVGVAAAGLSDVVRFPDGREVRQGLGAGPAIREDQVHAHEDALFALARLPRLNHDASSPFRGRLDLARIGAFGHSLGGTTSLVLAERSPSVRAAVNIDGDPTGPALAVRPQVPLLLISSDSPRAEEAPGGSFPEHLERVRQGLARSEARRTAEWREISRDAPLAYRVRVRGTRHGSFSDVALASGLIARPEQRWMRVGSIAGERGLRVTAELVRGFFDQTLLGTETGQDLDLSERLYPEIVVEDRRP